MFIYILTYVFDFIYKPWAITIFMHAYEINAIMNLQQARILFHE